MRATLAAAAAAYDTRELTGAGPAHWAACAVSLAAELIPRADVMRGDQDGQLYLGVNNILDSAVRAVDGALPLRAAIEAALLQEARA